MSITAAMVKDLREKTAAGMMDCKKALTECDGDMEKAVDWLRQKGLSKAAKKAGRATSEGLVGFELAADGKSGVAVEVKCETDFVARGDKFQGFVKDMVAQVAKGEYADSEALLAAPFVADASVTVKEALDGVIATTGENMGLGKFAKMELAAGKSGLIGGYLHSNGKLAVLVEMQTGSDAAAASEAFHEVAKNVAMQIAAASPLAVSAEGLNPEVVEHEREVYRQKAREEGKPEQIIEKIAEGAVKKFCKDVCLLDQLYIRDDKMTIGDLIKDARQTFLGVWIRQVLTGRPFEVWGGEQLRDFTYVDDCVDAMMRAALHEEAFGQIFNIGGGKRISLRDLADLLVDTAGEGAYEVREYPADRKKIDIGDYYADDSRLRSLLGWEPRTQLRDGLRQIIDYYRPRLQDYL